MTSEIVMRVLGALIALTGVAVFVLGAITALGTVVGTLRMWKVLLAIVCLGGGLFFIWAGNRLQGYGLFGKRGTVSGRLDGRDGSAPPSN